MADIHAGVFDLHVRHYSGRRESPEFLGGTAVKLTVIPSLARRLDSVFESSRIWLRSPLLD